MINVALLLKSMKRSINLSTPGVFCETCYYDSFDEISEARDLKRKGDYLGSFTKYMNLYRQTGKLSLIWVKGAFKTLACAGAVAEAYDLLMACTNYFIQNKIYNSEINQLRIHQVSIVLCALGYCGVSEYMAYDLKKYLGELSGNETGYVMPDIRNEFSPEMLEILLMHMKMYEKHYPNLVANAIYYLFV